MRKFLFLLLAAAAVLGAVASVPDMTPAQRKSRALLLAAMQRGVQGDVPEAHELYKRAFRLDPSNMEAAFSYGLGLAAMAEDSAELDRGLGLMRQYVDAYPEDYEENSYYAFLNRKVGKEREALRVLQRLRGIYPDKDELVVSLADLSASLGDRPRALAYYDTLERSMGPSPALSLRKMSVYLYDNDTVRALSEADRLIAGAPQEPDFYIMKGNLMGYIGRADSALFYLQEAERVAPRSGSAKMALAQYYKEQGDSAAYDAKIYETLLLDDVDVEEKVDMLAEYILPLLDEKKATEHADYLIATLIEQYPHEADIQDFAGQYEAEKGNWAEAAERGAIAVDMAPDNLDFQARLIRYLTAAEQYDKAVAAYEALPQDSLRSPGVRFVGAFAYMGADRYDKARGEAMAVLEAAIPGLTQTDTISAAQLAPLSQAGLNLVASAYSLIGDTYYKENDMPHTALAYDNALTADPDDASALNNYAFYLCENHGDLDKALAMSRKAVDAEPENSTYLDTYAWILFRRAEYPEALEYQRKAVEAATEAELTYELYEHLGDILFMSGDPGGALEQWQKALKLAPERDVLRRKVKYKTFFYE